MFRLIVHYDQTLYIPFWTRGYLDYMHSKHPRCDMKRLTDIFKEGFIGFPQTKKEHRKQQIYWKALNYNLMIITAKR